MKKFDFDKIVAFINTNKDVIQEASLGMNEDWFWTAQTIFEDGEFKREFTTNEQAEILANEYVEARKGGMSLFSEENKKFEIIMVNGINGSSWATPTLQIIFNDGDERRLDCSIGNFDMDQLARIEKEISMMSMMGVLSGPCQQNVKDVDGKL